jgi:hypothetical protein
MKTIKFQHNWNRKLDCDVFTTIRRHTEEKENYYTHSIGEEFDVSVNGITYCYAKLVHLYCDHLSSTPNALLMVDTGKSNPEDAFKVFKDFGLSEHSQIIVLTFVKVREV